MSGLDLRVPLAGTWLVRRIRELLDPLELRLARDVTEQVPPRRLRARTGVPEARAFIASGRDAARELEGALASSGLGLAEVESVLDFGCGPGRVLPHVASLVAPASCTGCDVSGPAIKWARRHRPELRWEVSRFRPPLPFGDGSFALVYSISVFSHIDEELQDRWLEEIDRVLRPGGVALLSVHGRHAFDQFRTGQATTRWSARSAFSRGPLGDGEFVFVPYRPSAWIRNELPGVQGEFGLAFHDERYVRQHWSRTFEVVQILPRAMTAWQDIVVVRKRPAQG
ncbi:MAG TPA: class I SAM-dependent methyltransferase [Solirubrobacteraceae bacterium]|nr:class I SAM-dependent methyltransferase [Solirubrobacteraceae bacterium]